MSEEKKKAKFLAELMEVPVATAMVFAQMIPEIPYDRIVDFGRFIVEGYEPKKSKILAVKEAVVAYRRSMTELAIRSGKMRFDDREEMIRWIVRHYRGMELVSGPASYMRHVVIGVDEEGRLVNKYVLDEHGRYKPLDHESSMEVYIWLFSNQHRIGDVEHITPSESIGSTAKAIGRSQEKSIDDSVSRMIGGAYARVDKS